MGADAQLSGVEAVEHGEQQSARKRDADAQRIQRASGIMTVAVPKQENQAAEQADHHADQQKDNENLQQDCRLARKDGLYIAG